MIHLKPDLSNNIILSISRDYFNTGDIVNNRYAMIFQLIHEDSNTPYLFQPLDISNNKEYYNEFILTTMSDIDNYNFIGYADEEYVEWAYWVTDDNHFNIHKYDGDTLPLLPGTYKYNVYVFGYRTGTDNLPFNTPIVGGNFDILDSDVPTETGILLMKFTDQQNPTIAEFNIYDDDIYGTIKNLIL